MTTAELIDRIVEYRQTISGWLCPCGCKNSEVAITRDEHGEVYLCLNCLEAGYACKLYQAS